MLWASSEDKCPCPSTLTSSHLNTPFNTINYVYIMGLIRHRYVFVFILSLPENKRISNYHNFHLLPFNFS